VQPKEHSADFRALEELKATILMSVPETKGADSIYLDVEHALAIIDVREQCNPMHLAWAHLVASPRATSGNGLEQRW